MSSFEEVDVSIEGAEVSEEAMVNELMTIRNITDAALRVEAWERFIDTYERKPLDEVGKEILWRAQAYLKIDRASVQIRELVG